MNTFAWLVKREFWEHRGGFLWAPVIASGIFLLINLMAIITGEVFSHRTGISFNGQQIDMLAQQVQEHGVMVGAVLDIAMYSAASIASIVLFFVLFFYCLGTLYDDRRDRSVLLWKSLPISDRDTVLSKVFSAGLLAPAIAVLTGIVCALGMLLMVALTASLHDAHIWQLLATSHPLKMMLTLLLLIPVNLVWALPTLGWLMLCSAWARSKPFLWAVGIPVGAGILFSWLSLLGVLDIRSSWFWAHVVKRLLVSVVPMGWLENYGHIFKHVKSPENLVNILSLQSAYAQLLQPQFWIGATAGILMIAVAIWVRGRRSDI